MNIQLSPNSQKYISLLALTLHTAILGLSMRYARTRSGNVFLSSTAVLITDIIKSILSLIFLYYEAEKNVGKFCHALYKTIIVNRADMLRMGVASLLFTLQNNLLYIAISNLDVATYQVTYQLKILTTAMFARLILQRHLVSRQWIALVLLVIGMALVQLAQLNADAATVTNKSNSAEQKYSIGLSCTLCACLISGFTATYLEKITKTDTLAVSLWKRLTQLSMMSVLFSGAACLLSDWHKIREYGFFFGYDLFVSYLILMNATAGFLVAFAVQYADNILKGFATSFSIILMCIGAKYMFHFSFTFHFIFGTGLVIVATFLYSGLQSEVRS